MLSDNLPDCRHRSSALGGDRWKCLSPRLILPCGFVQGDECRHHCRVVDHDNDDPANPRHVINVEGPSVSIAVGVVTAPRAEPTLGYTLRQIRGGGFAGPIYVFAEPGTAIPDEEGLIVTRRRSRLGLWDNWRSALASLLDNTDAPFILTCEDDLLVTPCAFLALQHAARTLAYEDWGYASLYTPWFNVRGLPTFRGWKNLDDDRQKWGSLAFCFSRESAEIVLRSAEVTEHRGDLVDLIVAQAVRRFGRARYYHRPSLVSHLGVGISSINHPPCADSLAVDFHAGYRGYQKPAVVSAPLAKSSPAEYGVSIAEVTATRRSSHDVRDSAPPTLRCDVVIPYCAADNRWLCESVDSILQQVGVAAIVHLINDGVPDDVDSSRDFRSHPRVRRYRNDPPGMGPFVASNRIAQFWETEFIAVQDADDIALPDRLQHSLSRLQESGADIFAASMEQFVDPDHEQDVKLQSERRHQPVLRSGQRQPMMPDGWIIHGTMMFRRQVFFESGGYSNWLCAADIEFPQRAIRMGATPVFDSAVVALRRLHGRSLSHRSDTGFGTALERKYLEICARRLELYGRPGVVPRLWGGLNIEQNGIGTIRLD